ncbi:MAG: T9SS type A sorting domain-containing protein [Bacteroidales bacterium]|nr:T9SS type A sorting domain-containing protein [Bacteroidales bacterium]
MKSFHLRLTGLLCALFITFSANSQSIPNGSFENWTVSGGLFGQSVTLDEWNGIRIQAGSLGLDFAKPLRDTAAQQGNYAASVSSFVVNPLLAAVVRTIVNLIDTTGMIDSTLDLTKPFPGMLSNAKVNIIQLFSAFSGLAEFLGDTNSMTNLDSLGKMMTTLSQLNVRNFFSGGMRVDKVPHRLTGYYKYKVGQNLPDTADRGILLMLCVSTDTTDTVPAARLSGGGISLLQPSPSFKKFNVDYLHFADCFPDSVIFLFLSSLSRGVEGSTLTVDNLSLSYYTIDTVKELAVDSLKFDRCFLSWKKSKAFSWQVASGPHGTELDSMAVQNAIQNKFTVTGLSSQTEYDVYVRAMFGLNMYGPWTPVCTFRTPKEPCDTVRGFDVSELTENSARLLWQADTTRGFSYHLQCLIDGGSLLADTVLHVGQFDLAGLLPDTLYRVRMQVTCTDTISDWSENSFRTPPHGVGLRETEGGWPLKLYPNPARGSFFVEHSATGPMQMEVCSVSGQLLESRTLTAERTECRLPAPGAYWVRFTSSLGTQVRKVVMLP